MSTSKHFFQAFSVVFASSILSGLVLLQNDLQACSNPAPNIVAGTCVIHWQLIAVALLTAVISGGIQALRVYLQDHAEQLQVLTQYQQLQAAQPAVAVTDIPAVPEPTTASTIPASTEKKEPI